MNLQSKFRNWIITQTFNTFYCTLFVSGTELQTDRQTVGMDRQTDDPFTRCQGKKQKSEGIDTECQTTCEVGKINCQWIALIQLKYTFDLETVEMHCKGH